MSSRRPKRPSSARRNISYDLFSQYVSGSRVRHVQSLLRSKADTDLSKPDSVLCIAGIDSRYNDGSRELINYLLFGFYQVRKIELEKSGFDEEVIDDLILLVRDGSVDIYCNPTNYLYLLPYVSHWHNVRFYCLAEGKYEEEFSEEFKIRSFISMVEGCQRIGIPYSSAGISKEFDKFAVEKWPIVQAYALEGMGGKGFFTMAHEVCDVSVSVSDLYSLVDPVALEVLLTEHLPLLERQWTNMTSTMNIEISKPLDCISQERLFEPLRSYFQHGKTKSSDERKRKLPYLLFGEQSMKTDLLQAQEVSYYRVEEAMIDRNEVKTMLCQAVDPKGALMCARTYFLTPFMNPFTENIKCAKDTDIGYLIVMYLAMTEAVIVGIETYTKTLSTTQARLKAMQTLHDLCGDIQTPLVLEHLADRSSVKFTIEALDKDGKSYPLKDGKASLLVKVCSITLFDIPSCNEEGRHLGSLVFSESFLDSSFPVCESGMPDVLDSNVLILTSHIPRYQIWAASNRDQEERQSVLKKLKRKTLPGFGDLIMAGDTVGITTGSAVTVMSSKEILYLFNNEMLVYSPQNGGFSLLAEHIKSFSLYDGDSSGNVMFLIVDLAVTGQLRIPLHLQSLDHRIVIVIPPASRVRKSLFQDVLPIWKSEKSRMPEVTKIDNLPTDLLEIHELLQIQHSIPSKLISPVNAMKLKYVPSLLPQLQRFLAHFSVSSVGQTRPILKQDVAYLLQDLTETPEDEAMDWIPVTVISGVPGSHKENLARTISNMETSDTGWTTICQAQANTFDPVSLQNSLTTAYAANCRHHTSGTYKRTRVIVITAGYTDIKDVSFAIINHPKPEVAAQVRIGAVTVCIDPLNTFMKHRLAFPTLLNQCAQGWVNCIVFTSSTSIKNEVLEDVQRLVRSINGDVALLLADKGIVRRSPDLELIMSEESFHHPAMVRARHLLNPGWQHGIFSVATNQPRMNQVVLRFCKPLDQTKLYRQFKGLKGALNPWNLDGNLYHIEGRVKFTGSNKFVDIHYTTLSGYMRSSPASEQDHLNSATMNGEQDCYLIFSGCNLQENRLMDWLRQCTKQRPERKNLIQRKEISLSEVKKIHSDHHLDLLPPGWFYNGNQFISMMGSKADLHPNLEEFISDWMEEKNKVITAFNAKVDEETFTDLFD